MTETVLYKHYDADDVPIYYGISDNNEVRQEVHQLYAAWVDFSVRVEESSFPNRREALVAEREAIKRDRPVFNKIHNEPGCTDRAVRYLAEKGRYDLLRPRPARPERKTQRYSPALLAWIESLPINSDGTRWYNVGSGGGRFMTDGRALEFFGGSGPGISLIREMAGGPSQM